ncbi:DNA-binding transcriptional regulator, PucR family [Terribacillus aidingensis]|uniref:DNA-binding transcriptional regulator, PucR family n=1 Tax=Terribacillus aidingensis TaxID=586416 RepID=A0A285N628_9BACI|nr:helix-turn-helix domain-containing protein [Terribacillus aidingensis]SNZ04870.1 DNA-binding transcriptional regulator, PucR family [Terribacillus aidingensis]
MELFDRVLSINDLDAVIDLLSFELERPVIVESADYTLLAYNSHYIHHFDDANQQTIFTKKWTLPIYERFIEAGIVNKLKTYERPFTVLAMPEIGLNTRIVVSAKHEERVMGYVWIQEMEKPLSASDVNFLYEISFHIGRLIYDIQKSKLKQEEKEDQFYQNIFNNLYKHSSDLDWGAKEFGVVLPDYFAVAAVELPQQDEQLLYDLKQVAQTSLQLEDKLHHVLIKDDTLLIVHGGKKADSPIETLAREVIQRIRDYAKDKGACILSGVGGVYRDSINMLTSAAQAREVIQAIKLTHRPVPLYYKDLHVCRYLQAIADKNKELGYESEDLKKIRQLDPNDKKELLKTLELYLLHNCKIKPTAAALFVHPNTVNYRINQINEALQLDMTDVMQKFQLLLDLMTRGKD